MYSFNREGYTVKLFLKSSNNIAYINQIITVSNGWYHGSNLPLTLEVQHTCVRFCKNLCDFSLGILYIHSFICCQRDALLTETRGSTLSTARAASLQNKKVLLTWSLHRGLWCFKSSQTAPDPPSCWVLSVFIGPNPNLMRVSGSFRTHPHGLCIRPADCSQSWRYEASPWAQPVPWKAVGATRWQKRTFKLIITAFSGILWGPYQNRGFNLWIDLQL